MVDISKAMDDTSAYGRQQAGLVELSSHLAWLSDLAFGESEHEEGAGGSNGTSSSSGNATEEREPAVPGAEHQGGAGLVVFPTIECIVLLLMCLYLLWGYADKKRTSLCMKLLTLVGWFLSFALVVFLPLDIYMTKQADPGTDDPASGEEYVLLSWWAFSYWTGNILGFFVIPLVQGYVLAGEFQRMERVQRAILLNVPIFLLYFVSFIVLLLMIYFLDDSKNILDQQGILAVVVAVCLAAGFTLLVCFLGYGLVKIPVQMWVQSNYSGKLNRLLFKVAIYEDQIID